MGVLSEAEKNIESTIRNINKLWVQGKLKELEQYFHRDMVIQGPGFQESIIGKSHCLKHYENFFSHTDIKSYQDSEYVVNVWEKTAVASYKFDIEFEADGVVRKESGYELYTFVLKEGGWNVVWNTIVPHVTQDVSA